MKLNNVAVARSTHAATLFFNYSRAVTLRLCCFFFKYINVSACVCVLTTVKLQVAPHPSL